MADTIGLGQRVQDKITGASGIVTARHEYLYGCTRLSIQPAATDDGKQPEVFVTDEPQVEVVSGDDFTAEAKAWREAAQDPTKKRHGTRPVPGAR